MAKSQLYQLAFQLNAKMASSFVKTFETANKSVSGLVNGVKVAVGTIASIEGAKNIISTYSSFEQSMANVSAVTGQTGEGLKELEKLARDMGAKTSKSASEAADAIQYMGLAGWDSSQIMKGLEPVLRLSEAGGLDLARTSDLVTDSMSALGLTVDELPTYLDMAAQTSRKANTDIGALLEAMIGVGGTFNNLNVPMSEANGLLGILANRGKKGSEAGNALNSILVNLTSGAGQAGKAMKELGLNAFDSKGNFKGITNVLLELDQSLQGMTEEQKNTYLSMIGGKTQLDTLQALLSGVTEEYTDLEHSIANSDGALMEMANTMNSTLNGSWAMFLSAMDELKIKIGEKVAPYLKQLIDFGAVAIPKAFDLASKALKFTIDVFKGGVDISSWYGLVNGLTSLGMSAEDASKLVGHLKEFLLKFKEVVLNVKDVCVNFAHFVVNNWSMIQPVVVGIGAAFLGWKVGTIIGSTVKSIIGFGTSVKNVISTTKSLATSMNSLIVVKAKDKLETLYLKALYAGDFLKSLASNTRSIVKNSIAWGKNTAMMLLQKGQLIALKGIQLISTGATAAMTAAQWALNAAFIASPIGWIVLGIGALIVAGIALYKNWDLVKAKALELWESFKANFGGTIAFFEGIWATVSSIFSGAFENLKGIVEGMIQMFGGIITFFQGVFTGNWQMVWDGLKEIVAGAFQSLVGLVKAPINAVVGIINKVIDGINSISINIPEWVPVVGGKSFGVSIPQIPMFAKGTTGYTTPDTFIAGEKGAELVTNAKGYRVFTASQTKNMLNQYTMPDSVTLKNMDRMTNHHLANLPISQPAVPRLDDKINLSNESQKDTIQIQITVNVNNNNNDKDTNLEEKVYQAAYKAAEAAVKKIQEVKERRKKLRYG